MSTAKDGEKVVYVGTVKIRGCRSYLEKIFKENLKGGVIYEFSCGWLTGIKLTPSPLSPPKLEELDHDNEDTEDTTRDYSSFVKKVLWQNTKGGVLHEFSHSWLTGSRLTPVAFLSKTDKGSNSSKFLTADGYRHILGLVIYENLSGRGEILHEYSYGRRCVKLTPLLPEQRPSPIHYEHRIFHVLKHSLICHHFIRGISAFAWLDKKIVLQPHRISPDGDDHQHQTGPVADQE